MTSVAEDHESFYRDTLLPYKLRGYSTYLDQRTWSTDLRVLWQTLVAVVKPSSAPVPSLDEIRSSRPQGQRRP